jgi:FkbM family methyltransferase
MVPAPLHESGHVRLKLCKHGPLAYNWHDTHVGRSLDLYGEYCETEVELFRQLVRPGQIVIDAGANIGALTVCLAQQVGPTGAVFAFEPQRLVFQLLNTNVALAGLTNVTTLPSALGARTGSLKVPELDPGAPNNIGSLGLGTFAEGDEVPVMTLDELGLQRCHFIKIDVEGMEEAVLWGASDLLQRCQPRLYVENDRREKSPGLIRLLLGRGYRCYWHMSPFYRPLNHFHNADNVFGPLVCLNMLCLPPGDPARLGGFAEVTDPEDWPRFAAAPAPGSAASP